MHQYRRGGSCSSDISRRVPGAALVQCLVNKRFYDLVSFTADRRHFADNQVTCSFEHPLLAEGERLSLGQKRKILQDFSYMKYAAGLHFFKKIFISVFPIRGGIREVSFERSEQSVAFG